MLAFLTRNRRQETQPTTTEPETTETDTTPQAPAPLMRFLTQGGAEVHVTGNGSFERGGFTHHFVYNVVNHRWKCLGCGDGSDSYDRLDESDARRLANGHAASCRAMHKPAA